jgi:hypothetical protein
MYHKECSSLLRKIREGFPGKETPCHCYSIPLCCIDCATSHGFCLLPYIHAPWQWAWPCDLFGPWNSSKLNASRNSKTCSRVSDFCLGSLPPRSTSPDGPAGRQEIIWNRGKSPQAKAILGQLSPAEWSAKGWYMSEPSSDQQNVPADP